MILGVGNCIIRAEFIVRVPTNVNIQAPVTAGAFYLGVQSSSMLHGIADPGTASPAAATTLTDDDVQEDVEP